MPTAEPFAILRTEKIKTWGELRKSHGHTMRTSQDTRTHLADVAEPVSVLVGSPDWVDGWRQEVEGMHLRKLQQGQAHTLAREFFLGMSPEWAEGKSKKEIEEWARANVDWLQKRFGIERVRFVALHTDEQSPHLACYVLPLKADTKPGRGNGWTLSDRALKLGGDKEALSELQTEYAQAMERFKLRRGIKGSKATHQKTAAWRAQMARPLDAPIIKPKPEAPTLADRMNPEAYGKRVADATATAIFKQMKPYHQQAKAQARELQQLRGMVEHLRPLADAFKRFMARVLGHPADLGSVQGLNHAHGALNAFLEASLPKPTPPGTEKPQALLVAAPANPQRPSPMRGRSPSP